MAPPLPLILGLYYMLNKISKIVFQDIQNLMIYTMPVSLCVM